MDADSWHSIHCGADWQYCIVFWQALDTEPFERGDAPDGSGWMLNRPAGKDGLEIVTPCWSDGSIVLYRVHWRRPSPGMRHWHLKSTLRVDHRPWFVGSKIPEQLLTHQDSSAHAMRRPLDDNATGPGALDSDGARPTGHPPSKKRTR